MEFHLSRETGRILRAVQRGAESFVTILNVSVFNILPVVVKMLLVSAAIWVLYDYQFLVIIFGTMILYFIAIYCLNEWKAKFFKEKNQLDSGYSQKAIDSLINFETVKYFNAEDHERDRFKKALELYKES